VACRNSRLRSQKTDGLVGLDTGVKKGVVFRDSDETVGMTGRRYESWFRLSGAGFVIVVVSFDVFHQCGQFLYFHRVLVESDIHDTQDIALPGTNEFL